MLNQPISENNDPSVTHILRIMEIAFSDSQKSSDVLIAYTISVCEVFLSPENENIQMSESIIKSKLEEHLVSFATLCK